jgi:hypothetical protein
MNEVSRRPRSTAAERALWKQRFLNSGLLLREFAAQHGFKLSTLQRWVASAHDISLGTSVGDAINSKPNSPPAAPLFAQVQWSLPASSTLCLSASSPSSAWAAELIRPDGSTLRLANDVSSPLLNLLLRSC